MAMQACRQACQEQDCAKLSCMAVSEAGGRSASEQRTDDDGDGLLLADGGLAALDLVEEDAEVGLGADGGGQLGHQVVVVGVEELGHVKGLDARHAARHGKVLLIA